MTEEMEKQEKTVSGDDIRQFLCEIREFPRLSAEEERELARRCADGDEAAIRRMVTSNLRLVVSVAREYAGRGVALLDLIQEGSIGLLVAAKKFDYTLDYRFSTYATKWIRQGVTRCLMNTGTTIRLPLHTAERLHKVVSVRGALFKENGKEPTVEEIAQRSGLSAEKVSELRKWNPEICSLDSPVGENEKATLGDLIEDIQALEPQEALVRQELEQLLKTLLSTLNERQQKVLRLHFGLEDGKDHSLEEIGRILGISKERARQIERQAMDKLLAEGASMGLEDFLE